MVVFFITEFKLFSGGYVVADQQGSMDDVYVVILAGGSGTRFWPKSRLLRPKQLCQIGDGDGTMLEQTIGRLEGFVPPERRIIVTHHKQKPQTEKVCGDSVGLVLAEPEARNTAAALALAALEIKNRHAHGNPVMISLHADHVIRDRRGFLETLKDAVQVARTGRLTLLGIPPKSPDTGFGYIERGNSLAQGLPEDCFQVASFREKPPQEVAQEYVDSGRFYWNAGLFIWGVETLLAELRAYLPETVEVLESLEAKSFADVPDDVMAHAYGQLQKIAIDHAVLEKSQKVAVLAARFDWQDVGSWDSLTEAFAADKLGNFFKGKVVDLECKNTTIDTDGPLVACIGLDDMVVVAAGNAVLVCPKARSQEVKKIVEHLQETGGHDYL